MKATATYDSATGKYTHKKGKWSDIRPIADLPRFLAFYREQQQRYPAYAATYQDHVEALEGLLNSLHGTSDTSL